MALAENSTAPTEASSRPPVSAERVEAEDVEDAVVTGGADERGCVLGSAVDCM